MSKTATILVALGLLAGYVLGKSCWFGPLKVTDTTDPKMLLKRQCDFGYIGEGFLNSCYKGSDVPISNVTYPVSESKRDDCVPSVVTDEDQWSVTAPDACRMCDDDAKFKDLKEKYLLSNKSTNSKPNESGKGDHEADTDTGNATTEKPKNELTREEKVLKSEFLASQKIAELPQENVLSSTGVIVSDIARGCFLKYMNHGLQKNSVLFWFIVHQDLPSLNLAYSKRCSSQTDFIGDSESADFLKRILVKCEVDGDKTEVVTVSSLFGTTEMQYTEGLLSTCGHNSLSVWQNILSDSREKAQGTNYLICRNGTISNVNARALAGHKSCTIVFSSRFLESCAVGSGEVSEDHCKIESSDSVGFKHRLVILNRPAGVVSVNSDLQQLSRQCTERCEVTIESAIYVVLICTSGRQVFKQYVDEVSVKCPFISYALSGRAATAVCRATDYPVLVMVLLVWIFTGYLICVILLLILKVILMISCGSARMLKNVIMKSRVICEDCGCEVEYKTLETLHETCEGGICPYCRLFKGDKLKEHADKCPEKKSRVTTAAIDEVRRRKKSEMYNRMMRIISSGKLPVILWVIVTFSISLPIVVGETSRKPSKTNDIISDLFKDSSLTKTLINHKTYMDQLEEELDECGTGCVRVGLECECSRFREEMVYGRRLLSVGSGPTRQSPLGNPSGFVNQNITFMPTSSDDTIELVFQSSTRTGNTVLVSGNAVTDFVPEENAGISFKVSSPESNESKTVSISIRDVAQIYKTRFIKWVSDRTVYTDSEVDCTGQCSERCFCNSTDCTSKRWPDDRGWACNPSWCLSINAGCTCCMMHAIPDAESALYSLWEVNYLETRLVVCLNSDVVHYSCKELTGGGNFNVDKFEIGITKPFGTFNTLPKSIAVKHNLGHSHPSIGQTTSIFLNPDFCSTRHCTHGELGDYSFTSIEVLSSKISQKMRQSIYMSWKGTGIDRVCEFAEGPRCMESGVVTNQKDLFRNFEQTGDKLENKFKTVTALVQHDDEGEPSLKLAVTPLIQKGLSQMLIKVKGLELRSSKVSLELSKFEITRCGGCRNCVQGFWCAIKVSITKPESYFIHIKSSNPSTTADKRSILVTNQIEIVNISLFSAIKEPNVELCVMEVNRCSTFGNLTLSDPVGILIDPGTQIVSPFANNTAVDLGWLAGLGSRVGGMFKGMWESIKWLFGGWLQSAITVLVLVLIVVLLLKPCKGRRLLFPGFSVMKRREKFGRVNGKRKVGKQI